MSHRATLRALATLTTAALLATPLPSPWADPLSARAQSAEAGVEDSGEAIVSKPFGPRLADAAQARTRASVRYDGAYRRIAYPMGDVPDHLGVCTDLVIRAYRALGIDLQERVHQDMRRAFRRYPQAWGLRGPDPNIDHRRVLNLERFFERQGAALPVSDDPDAFQPGDLVTYRVGGGRPHIGVISERTAPSGRPLVVHNIGFGPRLEDFLFAYPIVGHYRWRPEL